MEELTEFVLNHTTRSECQCGFCLCSSTEKLSGHTVNLTFFTVGMKNDPKPEAFNALVRKHLQELWPMVRHSYIALSGLMGDQEIALRTMGLGHLLGIWQVFSPDTECPDEPHEAKMAMAVGRGGIWIKAYSLGYRRYSAVSA